MEAIVALELVSHGIAVCSRVVTELKRFSHDYAQAEARLGGLIEHVERVKRSATLLSMIMREAARAGYGDLGHAGVDGPMRRLDGLAAVILQRASDMAGGAARLGVLRRLRWTLGQRDMEALMGELREVDAEARRSVALVTQYAHMRRLASEAEAEAGRGAPLVRDAFDEGAGELTGAASRRVLPTWLGHVVAEGVGDEKYLALRGQLADAVKYGRWDDVFALVEAGARHYGESWANATRIKPRSEAGRLSLWTPLHQAVYMRAPADVVARLIGLGASRTLRTRWTEFAWADMSALELARELGVGHLGALLEPVVRSPVPPATLQRLEDGLHCLVRHELGRRADELLLPALEALTESAPRPTWFPVRGLGRRAGYVYQLDARDLVVLSLDVGGAGTRARYRITEDDILEVDEASVSASVCE